MAVNTDRIVFYHIPKTGGTWVKEAMKNAGISYRDVPINNKRHPLAPMLFITHVEPDYISMRYKRDRFSFCFIRHPVDWYRSYWCGKVKLNTKKDDKSRLDELYAASKTFSDWVNAVLDEYPNGFVTQLYQYYIDKVNFVGEQEHLKYDLVRALNRAGEDFDANSIFNTPRVNTAASETRYARYAIIDNATFARAIDVERRIIEKYYD